MWVEIECSGAEMEYLGAKTGHSETKTIYWGKRSVSGGRNEQFWGKNKVAGGKYTSCSHYFLEFLLCCLLG